MKTEEYIISGMSCAACSASVQRVVSRLDCVKECEVNLITGKMTVSFDSKKTGEADFIRVVEKAGFGIEKAVKEKAQNKKPAKTKVSFTPILISALFSSLLLYISMGQMLFKDIPLPAFLNMENNPYNFALTQLLLCIPALYFGRKFFINGIPLLFKGHPNMDTLVAIGSGASFIYSVIMTYTINYNPHAVHNLYYESAAVVVTLVMLGKYFETKSKNKTADAIQKLIELSPDTATVVRDGVEYTVALEEIAVGETIAVKAGSKIALDGVIIKGNTSCDESMLTGESLPVEKKEGDTVTGGSINLNGHIFVRVTHIGEDTALAKIIKFVENAQSKKAPISKTADKVAGVFVPAVIIIALLSALVWLISGKDISFALRVFTGVLVVACPCALGLATPTAIMVGTGLGAQNGILIRNGEVLETTHKIKVAVFDKTGTVTEGKMSVTDIIAKDEKLLLKAVASAESGVTHPIAQSITEFAKQNNIPLSTPEKEENISGMGIKCLFEKEELLVGKIDFLKENGIEISSVLKKAEEFSSQGKTLVFASLGGKIIGIIALADSLKENSKSAFLKLKKMGIETVLLSGDNKLCAEYIGKELHADKVFSEVLPNEKANIIKQIKKETGSVLMVGDGINDAPALTVADVGCAIGKSSDIAIESADIVLMKSDPQDIAKAVNLSRLTIRNIKQNLFWAFCYNTALIPIASGLLYAFGGPLISPMLAGLAMSFSSVFVVSNALRLRTKKL